MIEPTTKDVGRGVVYVPRGPVIAGDLRRESGVVSSWNEYYVFVRFGALSTAMACRREDLQWEHPN